MITAKCTKKLRDNNNVIIGYELQASDGETISVTSYQLRTAIKNNQIDVINLQLTKDDKIINKSVSSSIDGYSKMAHSDEESELIAEKQLAKAKLLGVAPLLNERGGVIGVQGDTALFTDKTREIADDLSGKIAIFKGNLPIELFEKQKYLRCNMNLAFDEIFIYNPCIVPLINKEIPIGSFDVRVFANKIFIDHNIMELKTIDEVFKILKNQINNLYLDNKKFTKLIVLNITNFKGLDVKSIFNRALMILNRQKKSGKAMRRLYDLSVYETFIYSMWYSTKEYDSDTDVLDKYKTLYTAYKAEIDSIRDSHNIHSVNEVHMIRDKTEREFSRAAIEILNLAEEEMDKNLLI